MITDDFYNVVFLSKYFRNTIGCVATFVQYFLHFGICVCVFFGDDFFGKIKKLKINCGFQLLLKQISYFLIGQQLFLKKIHFDCFFVDNLVYLYRLALL